MAYTKTNWENDVTELSAENFNHIEDGIYNSTNLELYGVYNEISEVPTNTPNGKLFYLSSTNKIYEVTNTGAYHEFAEPISGIFYIVPSEQKNYAYNGTTLVSVGGGGGSATGDTLPIGAIIPFGGINAPAGWLVCDGSEVSRTTYSELFAVIGTSYGAGDGSTTFNLPNKKGKVSVGLDTSDTDFNTIGKKGGVKSIRTSSISDGERNDGGGTDWNKQGLDATASISVVQPYEVDQWIIKASQTAGLVASVVNTPSTSDKDTYSCDYINKLNTYSTEEKVIGIYENEDGTKQPLYRKIIDTNDNSSNILHGISNLKNVITCKGNIKRTSSAVVSQLFPHIDTDSNYNVDVNYFSSTTIYLLIGTSILSSITGFRLILEYTKTTD